MWNLFYRYSRYNLGNVVVIYNIANKCFIPQSTHLIVLITGGHMQSRVQEFVRGGGGPKSESLLFCFQIFRGGGPAQKIAKKMRK